LHKRSVGFLNFGKVETIKSTIHLKDSKFTLY